MSDVSGGPGWWQASNGKWYRPEQHPDYRPPPPPAVSATPLPPAPVPFVDARAGSTSSHGTWRWWLRAGGVVVALIGVVLLFTPISAKFYDEYYPPGSFYLSSTYANADCITAWDYWTGHFAHPPSSSANSVELGNDQRASQACTQVIPGREHLSLTLIVFGGAALGISFLRRRVYVVNATTPASAPVVGPAQPS